MTDLLEILIYIAGVGAGTAMGTRVFYGLERRDNPQTPALQLYRQSALEGAVCGLLWPVALPLLIMFAVGWISLRATAPREVRTEVRRYNSLMLERAREQDEHLLEGMRLAIPAGCGTCTWTPDGSLLTTPGCSYHDPDAVIADASRRR